MLDLLMAVVETSYTSLPLTGRAGSGCNQDFRDIIPGWTKEVEPLRLESNLFYCKWLAAGKPRQGEHHEAKLCSHAQYRYAIRRVKRASKLHQTQGLFGASIAGDIELRVKTGKGQMDELTERVDGVSREKGEIYFPTSTTALGAKRG